MFALSVVSAGLLALASTASAGVTGYRPTSYVDWRTFKANGVNLGGWLVQEAGIDPAWWVKTCGNATDEWTCCPKLGAQCGPALEHHYATFIQTADIDKLATAGINVLRIPTTYAAWTKVPNSQLYSGNQALHLKKIASYAIAKYGMHIIIDIHGLPGGINGLEIGEAFGRWGWFNNQTNLDYSLKAVDAILHFIQTSGSPQSYTLEPINEPADNHDFSFFGQSAALSENGAAWLEKYIKVVIAHTEAVNAKIPVMFQGSFKGEAYWSARFSTHSNLVFDQHNYWFGKPSDSSNITADICAVAKASAGDGKFPVFVGEWSIQTTANNRFANRAKNLNTGLYAFAKYTRGSAYWAAKFYGNVTVPGEGVNGDYWNYESFIDMGIIKPSQGQQYCS